ncbi:MAG: helix-turn-helix transcriptional regulator [Eubacteriales bacterium]|nr:helix-turn-helix transcriptional regulator [Eubacteriales bacterium]
MILADKIMSLRKRQHWSQEELAGRLEVSRQSVSKWESGASIPDIGKIVRMSELFGVSTDYLLKEDEELPPQGGELWGGAVLPGMERAEEATGTDGMAGEGQSAGHGAGEMFAPGRLSGEKAGRIRRSLSMEEANEYLEAVRRYSLRIALGVLLCIISPVALILMDEAAAAERRTAPSATETLGRLLYFSFTEDAAGALGAAVIIVLVAVAVVLFILSGMALHRYDYLDGEEIDLQYGVAAAVTRRKESQEGTHRISIAAGIAFCIVGVVPLLLAQALGAGAFAERITVALLLVMIGIGVFLIVRTSMVNGSFQRLLQEEDYTPQNKRIYRKLEPFSAFYWCGATAVYLGWSFPTMDWGRTWVIWPVAGVLFGGLYALLGWWLREKEEL